MRARRVQSPTTEGQFIGAYTWTTSTTDWTDFTSASFKDQTTGSTLAAGLQLTSITVVTDGSSPSFIKLRALDTVSDPTADEIAVHTTFSYNPVGLVGGPVTTFALKKDAGATTLYLIAAFNDGGV
jgi:hypothetical protein